ncbi:MAG: hypothetical protein J5I47_07715 [Vicingus serpentipes]|nr:hypothetical protein [Vicingus serpentipes]
MVRLGDIIQEIREIEDKTLRKATHLAISQRNANSLVSQYTEICNSDLDSVLQYGETHFTIKDVSEFLGIEIVLYTNNVDDFKILEQITTDS